MFFSNLQRIPKNRAELLNDLEIPEDVILSPYILSEDLSDDSSIDIELTESSESSLALSRAMTDSEIDYERYRRLKSRSLSDPWVEMRAALDAFSPGYLDSLSSNYTASESTEDVSYERDHNIEDLKLKMLKFFEEECCVFVPDDPGLSVLEKALEDLEFTESDSQSSTI